MLEGRNLLVIVVSVVLGVGVLIPAVCAFVIVFLTNHLHLVTHQYQIDA